MHHRDYVTRVRARPVETAPLLLTFWRFVGRWGDVPTVRGHAHRRKQKMPAFVPKSELVPDIELRQLALKRGPGSAEAYMLLELREVRSGGDDVFAYERKGRYRVGPAPSAPGRQSSGDPS